jgi:hypothetical protein
MTWYDNGAAQVQSRWITRPIVPDVTRLNERENAAWQRVLFPLPWDIQRKNIAFEGGIRMYEDERLEKTVQAYDGKFFPAMEKALRILDSAAAKSPLPVLLDQRDRYRGFLLCCRTVRNLFEAQAAINAWLTKKGDSGVSRARLRWAIESEIANAGELVRLLRDSGAVFFRTAEVETPFLYRSPLEDLELKIEAMRAHIDDEPGPYLPELKEPHSIRKLLYY